MTHTPITHGNSFLRFCVVGAIGFAVDLGLLQLALQFGYSPIQGRIFSIIIALTVTWILHRYFTFQQTDRRMVSQYSRFVLVALLGASLNFLIYSVILLAAPQTSVLIALIVASAAALSANYLGSRYFAFS